MRIASESDKKEPTLIGPGSDGCTVEQRVAFLCSLYKIAAEAGEGLISDPKFLKKCFEDLIFDQDKTMTFMLLYSCNKIQPECYALPRKHGLARAATNTPCNTWADYAKKTIAKSQETKSP